MLKTDLFDLVRHKNLNPRNEPQLAVAMSPPIPTIIQNTRKLDYTEMLRNSMGYRELVCGLWMQRSNEADVKIALKKRRNWIYGERKWCVLINISTATQQAFEKYGQFLINIVVFVCGAFSSLMRRRAECVWLYWVLLLCVAYGVWTRNFAKTDSAHTEDNCVKKFVRV